MASIINNFNICSKIQQHIKINIKSFYVFNKFSEQNIIFVTNDDRVYGLGVNFYGVLGLGHEETFGECTEIKELSKQRIKEIYMGGSFALALNEDNHIFGWGRNEYGELGRGYNTEFDNIFKPQKIVFPSNEKINDICCGVCHTLTLLSNGVICGWGWNRWGQLGLNKTERVNEPQIIEISGNIEKFKYIYCCHWSSFAITTNGLLFSWGYNGRGILGQGVNDRKCIPRRINLFNVQKICAEYGESYFLTNEGSIYFCNNTQNTPKIIEEKEKNFTDLEYNYCCDAENIFYKLNDGKLEIKGKFESFNQIFAKELKITSKMIHIGKSGINLVHSDESQKFKIEDIIRNSGILFF